MSQRLDSSSPLDHIPPPDQIRDHLARVFAEIRLLRRLLRLAESMPPAPDRDVCLPRPNTTAGR